VTKMNIDWIGVLMVVVGGGWAVICLWGGTGHGMCPLLVNFVLQVNVSD
jgi:hypothetical protein